MDPVFCIRPPGMVLSLSPVILTATGNELRPAVKAHHRKRWPQGFSVSL